MAQQIIRLKIKDTKRQIETKIKNALKKKFANGRILQLAAYAAAERTRGLFRTKMRQSATYKELSSNSFLLAELGLEHGQAKIDAIMETWVKSLKLTIRPARGGGLGISGGFKIEMVRSNYAEVFRLREAKQRATSKRPKSQQALMRWLEWLLLRGDEKIVIGYYVKFQNTSSSRTGLAVMLPSVQHTSWSVPPGFTGTKNNNFVTEVLQRMERDILKIMIEEIAAAARKRGN